jgi:hypothetical protein
MEERWIEVVKARGGHFFKAVKGSVKWRRVRDVFVYAKTVVFGNSGR